MTLLNHIKLLINMALLCLKASLKLIPRGEQMTKRKQGGMSQAAREPGRRGGLASAAPEQKRRIGPPANQEGGRP
jgi:hypothetical protein